MAIDRSIPLLLVDDDKNMLRITRNILRKIDFGNVTDADNRLNAAPFIMVTAENQTENVVAAKQAGVAHDIVKPFNAETLREKITNVLGHA